jgi:hypothetical protein
MQLLIEIILDVISLDFSPAQVILNPIRNTNLIRCPTSFRKTLHPMNLRSTLCTSAFIVPVAAAALLTSGASAAVFQYSLSFANGFLVEGEFATKASAPASFIEKNPTLTGETTGSWDFTTLTPAPYASTYLESQTMRVLQSGALMGEASNVVAGVCLDKFLYLNFSNVGAPAIAALDFSTVYEGASSYYFVSNGSDPSGTTVAFGSTGYNLFLFDVATSQGMFIATATSLNVTAVPAPGALALLAAAGASLGVGGGRRRRS